MESISIPEQKSRAEVIPPSSVLIKLHSGLVVSDGHGSGVNVKYGTAISFKEIQELVCEPRDISLSMCVQDDKHHHSSYFHQCLDGDLLASWEGDYNNSAVSG